MNLLRRIEEQKIFLENIISKNPTASMQELYLYFLALRTKALTWKDAGAKCFVLSKDLIEAFSLTDIPTDLRTGDFQYPFDSFMVEGQVPLFYTRLHGSLSPIHHLLFVHKRAIIKGGPIHTIGRDRKIHEAKDLAWDTSVTGFFLLVDGGDSLLENMAVHFKDHEPIEQALRTQRDGPAHVPLDDDDHRNLVNIFFNAVLFINDQTRDKKETEERLVRNHREFKGGPFIRQDYILLKTSKIFHHYAKGTNGERQLDKRFVVRGHWRNQPYGPNMTQRRMAWIKPYWKGPEFGEIVNKKYHVG